MSEPVGVSYCTIHNGILNEDDHSCDFRTEDTDIDDETGEPFECEPHQLYMLEPRPLRAEVYEAEDTFAAEYRWRVRHVSNGEIMASGEGYADKRDRDAAVRTLFPDLEPVEVDG